MPSYRLTSPSGTLDVDAREAEGLRGAARAASSSQPPGVQRSFPIGRSAGDPTEFVLAVLVEAATPALARQAASDLYDFARDATLVTRRTDAGAVLGWRRLVGGGESVAGKTPVFLSPTSTSIRVELTLRPSDAAWTTPTLLVDGDVLLADGDPITVSP